MVLIKQKNRYKRHNRLRAKIFGTAKRPRLCVFRSIKYIYAQLINDEEGKIIIVVDDRKIKKEENKKTKTDKAKEVGRLIAKEAQIKKIKEIIFDRGGYKYHGRVKAVAEGAREGGLIF